MLFYRIVKVLFINTTQPPLVSSDAKSEVLKENLISSSLDALDLRSTALGRHKNPLDRAQILNSPCWGVDYLS